MILLKMVFLILLRRLKKSDSELIKFLKSLYIFTTSISEGISLACSRQFIEIFTGKMSKDLSLPEEFSTIFKDTLQSKFDVNQL